MSKTALLIIDVQNDFLPPDGSLAVPDGRAVIPVIQGLLDQTKWDWDFVVPSQDYHPKGHISFASTNNGEPFKEKLVTNVHGVEYAQTLWPDHCVIGTKGAEIERELRHSFEPWKNKMKIVRKGCHCLLEAYSAFDGYLFEATDPAEPPTDDGSSVPRVIMPSDTALGKYLREQGVGKVVIVGLASDFWFVQPARSKNIPTDPEGSVLQTSLSSLGASFPTLLVKPATRGIDETATSKGFEKLEALGAKVAGKDGGDWEAEVREWIKY
ncbi:Isochorismatase-like protein [Naematelia encephala]|uniref:nicotinamidase n=1 Tax=Naematelia encephala TaxID=71784 RepID=A0A1Y2BLN7_9TREE|nr:Isochorismatase-like protein [Naematelia encephala]